MPVNNECPTFTERYGEYAVKWMNILSPFAVARQESVYSENRRFVHYCSASTGMNIIQKQEIWMRKATCMNDFLEIEHGRNCLDYAYSTEYGERFRAILNRIQTGLAYRFSELLNSWTISIVHDSYLASFSEHLDHEDELGRLSMWRAYGRGAGVALVCNNTPFLMPSNALGAYTTPVAYLDQEAFLYQFASVVENCENHIDFILAHDSENVLARVFNAMVFVILSTKHPGFAEEREWRVVHNVKLHEENKLIPVLESVDGIPQPIRKIQLKNYPEEGFTGATVPELIDRVIIGPAEYPIAMYEAYVQALHDAGVEEPERKVIISTIPLRR